MIADRYTVEVYRKHATTAVEWVPAIKVPTTSIADASKLIREAGYRWAFSRRWRIIDGDRAVVSQFNPEDRR